MTNKILRILSVVEGLRMTEETRGITPPSSFPRLSRHPCEGGDPLAGQAGELLYFRSFDFTPSRQT
jgi:hypothetical protein